MVDNNNYSSKILKQKPLVLNLKGIKKLTKKKNTNEITKPRLVFLKTNEYVNRYKRFLFKLMLPDRGWTRSFVTSVYKNRNRLRNASRFGNYPDGVSYLQWRSTIRNKIFKTFIQLRRRPVGVVKTTYAPIRPYDHRQIKQRYNTTTNTKKALFIASENRITGYVKSITHPETSLLLNQSIDRYLMNVKLNRYIIAKFKQSCLNFIAFRKFSKKIWLSKVNKNRHTAGRGVRKLIKKTLRTIFTSYELRNLHLEKGRIGVRRWHKKWAKWVKACGLITDEFLGRVREAEERAATPLLRTTQLPTLLDETLVKRTNPNPELPQPSTPVPLSTQSSPISLLLTKKRDQVFKDVVVLPPDLPDLAKMLVNRVQLARKVTKTSASILFKTATKHTIINPFLNSNILDDFLVKINLIEKRADQLEQNVNTFLLNNNALIPPHELELMRYLLKTLSNKGYNMTFFPKISNIKSQVRAVLGLQSLCLLYHPLSTKSFAECNNQQSRFSVRRIEEQKSKKPNSRSPLYKLMLNFKKHYLHITLLNIHGDIIFSISTNLFLKFFNYKKSLKKSKSFKILLMRYLRKLLIVTRINDFNLYVKKTSDQLNKLIQVLQKPINHSFTDPLTGRQIQEEHSKTPTPIFNFVYMVFVNNKAYGWMKTKNAGRLKRKISRRIIQMNRILD